MTLHDNTPDVIHGFVNAVIGILGSIALIDLFAFLVGLILVPVLAVFLGGRVGLRGIVMGAALSPVDRWIGFEHGNELTFHRVRERDGDYEALIEDEWVEFEADPDRWSTFLGASFGLIWEKTQSALEDSKASKHWVKDKEYVIDASKELGVLRDAEDPRILDDVQEDVLMRDGGGGKDMGPVYRMLMSLGALTLGSVIGILVLVLA